MPRAKNSPEEQEPRAEPQVEEELPELAEYQKQVARQSNEARQAKSIQQQHDELQETRSGDVLKAREGEGDLDLRSEVPAGAFVADGFVPMGGEPGEVRMNGEGDDLRIGTTVFDVNSPEYRRTIQLEDEMKPKSLEVREVEDGIFEVTGGNELERDAQIELLHRRYGRGNLTETQEGLLFKPNRAYKAQYSF